MTQAHTDPPIADDMLVGARPIGQFMGITERQVFHLADTNRIPVFRLGSRIAARKSTLRAWIEQQEAQAMSGTAA